jgi:small subunit ribosomal protein S1
MTEPEVTEPRPPAPNATSEAAQPAQPPAPAGESAPVDGTATEAAAATETAPADAAPAEDAPAPDGAPKKKRRRRRKRKPGARAEAQAPGAENSAAGEAGEGEEGEEEGAAEEGEAAAAPAPEGEAKKPDGPKGKKKKDKKKHDKPQRERPAFNVGDVVFGKVTEVTFHSLFIDLPGKGIAIFDRRELELPDDLPHVVDEHDEEEKEEKEHEAAAAAAPEAHTAEAPAADAAPPAEADKKDEEKKEKKVEAPPPLPPVICEVGANFVGIVHNDGSRGGHIVVTRHPRRAARARALASAAFRDKKEVSALVTGVIKGGVEVDLDGLRGFVPASHMDLRLGADLTPHVGKRMTFTVTQYAKRGRDLVLSRKAALEAEAKALREEALSKLEIGAIVDGVVKGVVPFGAFIDVGGVEGLVPLNEMSHNRADQPSDVFKVGETVQVKIVKVDEKGKVWLSRKAAIPDPWGEVAKKYALHTKHTGKVVRLQPFGAFVELEPGIDGLVHTADLSIKRIEHPEELVKVGDSIEVVVSNIDPGAHKIGLHPALSGDAANEQRQKVVLHKPVKAKVVAIDPGGLIVRICGVTGRNARAFIPASMTGTPRGTELRKEFPVGKEIEAKVMEMDPKRGEVKLSIRALSQDNERSAYRQYREQVNREAKFGTFGDLLAKKLQPKGG